MKNIKNGTGLVEKKKEEPVFLDRDFEKQIEIMPEITYTEARKSDEIPGGGDRPALLPGATSPKAFRFPHN